MNTNRRAFYITKQKFPSDRWEEEIGFGYFPEDPEVLGGASAEMFMRWYSFDRERPMAARLEVFDESWSALFDFDDVLASLRVANTREFTPDDFIKILLDSGFVDITDYEKS